MTQSAWAPFTLSWDDAPIDVSFLYADERPAGRRGFVRAAGGRLEFEDGTEARFWGTNLHGGANFPSHQESEQLARRLAKFGVNIVRLHQMDAEWSTPNIFQFNRAQPQRDTQSLDPESMDRLDYLISCAKAEGIYCYLDMLTYRKFLPADEVEAEDVLPHGGSPYVYIDPRMIELQKAFNESLWTHDNPYTGLAYKDDPAIALTELLNESDLFRKPPVLEPYRSRLEARYRQWAAPQGVSVSEAPIDFTAPDAPIARFLVEVQEDYYRQMIGHLRSVGVKVPIAGTNWYSTLGHLSSQLVGDFVDNHVYWNFPHWDDVQGTEQLPMVNEITGSSRVGVFHRSLDKPFFLSEWNHCWPDEWRAESPIAYAAAAAFQGWSGTTICGYRYSTNGPVDRLGGGATTIDGRTYRNLLNVFNDPALFGLFYHAGLLFRRSDVRRGTTRAVIEIDDDDAGAWRLVRECDLPALPLLAEKHVAGMSLPGHRVEADVVLRPEEAAAELETGEVHSDSGELGRNWKIGYGWIDTARTKVAYGFVGKAGRISLDGLELVIETDFATVALSSLTDDPIEDSPSILLTAVGRCDNSGARYDVTHHWQLDPGTAPVLIEPIEGEIGLRTSQERLKVWTIGERGEALCRVPATTESDGFLRFRIGTLPSLNPWGLKAFQWQREASMYYLIRR
jgi:hypothetical protein